jgi:hypothetical protein
MGQRNQIATNFVVVILGTFVVVHSARAQHLPQGRWASKDDAVAKRLIEMERDWAEDGCKQKGVQEAFLADDFQGTAPGGERYDKAEALKHEASGKESECRLDDAKVRFFGNDLAVIYGSERALITENGKQGMRCLVWTDTWLNRGGRWEIVAAQDTSVSCK